MHINHEIEPSNTFEDKLAEAILANELEVVFRDEIEPNEIVIVLLGLGPLTGGIQSMVHAEVPIEGTNSQYDLIALAAGERNHIELTEELERLRLLPKKSKTECGSKFTTDGVTIRGSYLYGPPCPLAIKLIEDAIDEKRAKQADKLRNIKKLAKGESYEERKDKFYRQQGF